MELTKIFKSKFFYLTTGVVLNTLTVLFSLFLPSSINKFSHSPFNFLWEFFTINWCAWNSVLTVIYNLNEIKNEHQKTNLAKKGQRDFGLLIAINNLVVMLVFTATLAFNKKILPADRDSFWWTNSIIWHYVAPVISLIYFFKFVRLKKNDFNKKNLFWITFPLPVIFFLANLVRSFSANPEYLGGKLKFKKFLIPPFEWAERGNFALLALFAIFSLLSFWFFAYSLWKLKRHYFPKTIQASKKIKSFRNLIQIRMKRNSA